MTVFITAKSMFAFTYFQFFLALLRSTYFLFQIIVFDTISTSIPVYLLSYFLSISYLLQSINQTFLGAVLKTNVISNVYIQ